jgi:hypothetical protein
MSIEESTGYPTNEEEDQLPSSKLGFPIDRFSCWLLVVSSCFFLIPGTYAFTLNLYFYGVVSYLTTMFSVNFWYYGLDDWRRALDGYTAKVSFAIYFVTGCVFIRNLTIWLIGIPGCLGIIFGFYMSQKAFSNNNTAWAYYHMIFHLFVAFEQALVLYGANEANAQSSFAR